MKLDDATPWPALAALTAFAYALASALGLLLAIPPGYASPLYPSAGIALVSVLFAGPRMLVGVWVGSFACELALYALGTGELANALPLALCVASGATLQAWAGAWLVRRFHGGPLTLAEPGEVVRFFLHGGALACTVSASVGAAALVAFGRVPPEAGPATWFTWWTGDTMGVLIGAPMLLAIIGRPAHIWGARRVSVALPLALVTLLAAAGIVQSRHWGDERARALVERDAASAGSVLAQRLQVPLHALEAMHSLFLGSDDVDAREFRRAAQPWSDGPEAVQALGWAEALAFERLEAFEAGVRADGWPDYAVFDRAPDGAHRPPSGHELLPIRFIEPVAHNAAALGVNTLSVPEARQAIGRAGERPSATAGFRLTQESDGQVGVVVYRAVRRGPERSGVLFVTLRMDDLLGPVQARMPAYLHLCLVDGTQRLAGAEGCERVAATALLHTRDFDFGQRRWQLRAWVPEGMRPGSDDAGTWAFAGLSLLTTALLGALLLGMSGRAQRIESAVEERTAALSHEIDERARTEAALRDSEQRLRNILGHVPIGVIYTDLQGFIKQSNPKFRDLVGYGAEELSERRAPDFVHPEDREGDAELAARLVRGEIPFYHREQRFVRRDGQVLWVRSIVSLLREAGGAAHRMVAVVEDITEHLALRRAEDARELAEAANRAKNDFLSRMSHELRTPLNAMLGFAQLIEMDRQSEISAAQREWVRQIQTAGWHLLEMINDTLDLSRIESGTMKLDLGAVELASILDETLPLVEGAARERGIAITQALAPEALQVRADATRVKQILTNLLSNAVKYNRDGGRVHVASRIDADGAVEIAVADTGLGMTPQQLAGLFQPFNRLGRERSEAQGTGIGLVVSQRLAALMGGALRAHSTGAEGSTFVLTLPRALLPSATVPADAEPDEQAREYRRRVVHYIEDNETNAIVMEGILAQRPQVVLRQSSTGLDGLAAIRAQPPSLILLDMHLPDIDGLQLLRMLKDDPATAAIPVVVVSADAVAGRIRAALDAGAEHYLTKPVNVPELLRVLDELLEQRDTLFG